MTELPDGLRAGLAEALAGVSDDALSRAVAGLVDRYRGGAAVSTGAPILASSAQVRAYAAYRMPATYAAARSAFAQVAAAAREFAPCTQVDVGGGTGAAVWAAADVWPSLRQAKVIEGVPQAIDVGRRLASHAPNEAVRSAYWRHFVWLGKKRPTLPRADLITMSYLLGELPETDRSSVLADLAARGEVVVVVEPGTPAGYRRVLGARRALIDAGMTVVAPCPHSAGCPIPAVKDWCHFSVRVPRTALHRRIKGGSLGYEDEKFCYVAASRAPHPQAVNRVVRHPMRRKGLVSLRLCPQDPAAGLTTQVVGKRDGERYRRAKDAEWGDAWPPASCSSGASG